jgi:hypothetical protein
MFIWPKIVPSRQVITMLPLNRLVVSLPPLAQNASKHMALIRGCPALEGDRTHIALTCYHNHTKRFIALTYYL